jgi:hypothetical protein
LITAGTRSLTATDSVTSTITGSETGITVTPAAASTLIVAGFPSPITAGTSGTFTVTAKDGFGNTATGYTGTLHFTSSDGKATLPADSTLTNGTSSFSATLQTVGTQSITATDTVTSSITGTQSGITVNAVTLSLFHINFTNSTTDPDNYAGYTDDIGLAYGPRGGGLSFGWNQDNTANARDRNSSIATDERYDTLNQMQKSNDPNASWKIAVPNGTYTVHLVSGDPSFTNSTYQVNVNGVLTVSGTPTSSKRWIEGTVSITVTNGFITVTNATGSKNNKVNYIDITQTSSPTPLLANKLDTDPGSLPPGERDVVRLTTDSDNQGDQGNAQAAGTGRISSAGLAFVSSLPPVAQKQALANVANQVAPVTDSSVGTHRTDLFFAPDVKSLVLSLQAPKHSQSPADWFTDSWLADAWLTDFSS